MQRAAIFALAASLLAAAPQGDAKKDQQAIQGTWKAVAAISRGQEDPMPGDKSLVFTGDKFQMKQGDNVMAEGTFKLDPAKKAIDITVTSGPEQYKGKVSLGLYEISGDTLKWCAAEPGNENRPKEMKADVSVMFVTLQRQKK